MLLQIFRRDYFRLDFLQLLEDLSVVSINPLGLFPAILLVQSVVAVLSMVHRHALLIEALVSRSLSLHQFKVKSNSPPKSYKLTVKIEYIRPSNCSFLTNCLRLTWVLAS